MPSSDQTLEASPDNLIPGPLPIVRIVDPHADTMAARPSDADASAMTFPVENWSRYSFVRVLGQGGMGTVYEANDKRLDRKVALKFILGGNQELTTRFLREARAQARIEHENVCKVFEVGEIDGKAYIAMQLVAGQTLDKPSVFMTVDEKVIVVRDIHSDSASCCAYARDFASRHQARQYFGRNDPGWPIQADRHGFWSCAGGKREPRNDGIGRDRRDARVHVSRASARQPFDRSPLGRV